MSITDISIRHFRSIESVTATVRDLNIFVGRNDEGKSNILRALDLFFNGNKPGGYDYDWNRDYSCFAVKRVNKAPEITIQIVVSPPLSFTNRMPVIWTKRYRRHGLSLETIRHADGTDVKATTKIAAFLRAMRYDYVPAIKGKEYFQFLLAKMHDMLEATVEERIRDASGSFTKTINENTLPILEEILHRLGLQSTISLPSNLRSLFGQLEFTSTAGVNTFSLDQRGDGIKVRHIPIVLRWLAKQANHLSERGRPKTVTVWGYEEPENNLELLRCFDLARELVEGSTDNQTLVTTHSPAFYSVFRESDPSRVALFLVEKADTGAATKVSPLEERDLLSLDSSMGLMTLIAPHFKAARKEIEQLRSAMEQVTDTTKPTVYCEGPSDKLLLDEALKMFFPSHSERISVRCSAHHGGGHGWVADMLVAWSHSRATANAVGLLDKDSGASASGREANEKIKSPPSGRKAFVLFLQPNEALKLCFQRKVGIPFAIEELLPENIWNYAESAGWLEDRANPIALYNFSDPSMTFNEFIAERLPEHHLRRMALQKPRLESKMALAKYVTSIPVIGERELAVAGLKATWKSIIEKLNLD